MPRSSSADVSKPPAFRQEFGSLIHSLRAFIETLWSTAGRGTLGLLTVGTIAVICMTVAGQVVLNAWNKPFYDAIQQRNFPEFSYQCLVFVVIAGSLLAMNVAQAWLREMIKLKSREWLTRDLFAQWLTPGRVVRLAYAGEFGVNPDQRIQQDTSQLTDLAAELGIGLLQSTLLLIAFLGVLWNLSGSLSIPIGGIELTIPGYMVWGAIIFATAGSWLAWRVGAPLVGLNAQRFQRESGLRFALVQINQQADNIVHFHREESETERLGVELDNILRVMREIVGATARVTWVTAGYGWVSIIAPLIIAAPSYFGGHLSFGELMMVVGGFFQVNQSLRWFVDNFSRIAEWGATLLRVMSFREVLLDLESRFDGQDRIDQSENVADTLHLEGIGVRHGSERATLDQREIDVAPGDRIHIVDRTKSGRNPLLAAIAGLWPWGSGKLRSPPKMTMMFLKRRPYFPPGPLRAALAFPAEPSAVSDSDLKAALERVELGYLSDSLDWTAEWGLELSEDEQIRIAIARLVIHKPQWIFAEHVFDALSDEYHDLVRSIFDADLAQSAVISIGPGVPPQALCRKVIHLTGSPSA